MELAFPNINTLLRHEAAWDNPEASIILDLNNMSAWGDFIHTPTGELGDLSIYTLWNYPFNYPLKEHTRCIFKWFTLQFRHYLQRWRVRYLSAFKFMGTVCCL